MALRILILATVVCAICTAVPATTFAQSNVRMGGANGDDEVHLVGSWRVTQCPGPDEFLVLIAFNQGALQSTPINPVAWATLARGCGAESVVAVTSATVEGASPASTGW